MSGKQTAELIAVPKDNWQTEMNGYYIYQTLSEAETDRVEGTLFVAWLRQNATMPIPGRSV